jgi:hypothetical protein
LKAKDMIIKKIRKNLILSINKIYKVFLILIFLALQGFL